MIKEKCLLKQNVDDWNVSLIQLSLQLSDKQVIGNKELEDVLGFSFDTGEFTKDSILEGIDPPFKIQILCQLYDKSLIKKEILRKILGFED